MSSCSKCGNIIEIEAFYCPRCGNGLQREPLESNQFRELQFHIKHLESNEITWSIAGFTSMVAGLLVGVLTTDTPWVSGIFFAFAGVCAIALIIYDVKVRKCKRELMNLCYPPNATDSKVQQKRETKS